MPDPDEKDPKNKILEYTSVENGQFYRRKTVGPSGAEEWQYVTAHAVYGPAFSVRQGSRRNRSGEIVGPKITGGGNGDFVVMDLVDGELDVVRGVDFPRLFERVSLAKLPKEHQKKYAEDPTGAEA